MQHRVGFCETDAMGIVHHSNYLRFFENARVVWLETHDKSYPGWIEMGLLLHRL
jgi:acyl-CoA thioester hydrolase